MAVSTSVGAARVSRFGRGSVVVGRHLDRGTEDAPQAWWKRLIWYLVLSLLSVVVLFPVYMTLIRALSTPAAYVREGLPLYPVSVQWDVWSRAFEQGHLADKLITSALMTGVIVMAQLVTSIFAAYAFTFLDFPGRRLAFATFMATLMLPIEVTLIPNVITMRELGWMNSLQGLTAPFLATAFGTFLIRQGFLGIPRDLRDAAQLDGFGHLGFLRRVALPVTRPVVASFAVVAFLSAWNQYTWPRAVVTESSWETIQIGLRSLATATVDQSNIGLAAAILAAVPVLALLIFLQRHLIRGLTAGAVKG
jgi:sn-glycerol 3-phosphate transport system permease protein